MDPQCPFCRKLADGVPADELVWSFPHSLAWLGTWQYYEGYCVLASRRHATELNQLPDSERRGYLDEMCLLARAIEDVCQPPKLNYELLGNVVPHLHWHVIPRSKNDPDYLKPVWLALDAAERDPIRKRQLEGILDRAAAVVALRTRLQAIGAPTA